MYVARAFSTPSLPNTSVATRQFRRFESESVARRTDLETAQCTRGKLNHTHDETTENNKIAPLDTALNRQAQQVPRTCTSIVAPEYRSPIQRCVPTWLDERNHFANHRLSLSTKLFTTKGRAACSRAATCDFAVSWRVDEIRVEQSAFAATPASMRARRSQERVRCEAHLDVKKLVALFVFGLQRESTSRPCADVTTVV
jgi:hypothetical protein